MSTVNVRRGDTLSSIARRNHTTVDKLAQANHISDPNKIRTGAKLTVPGASDTYTPGGTTRSQRSGGSRTTSGRNGDQFETRGTTQTQAPQRTTPGSTTRSADAYNNALNRLDVEHTRRYQPTGQRGTSSRVTHCNEFVMDATRSMGVPLNNGTYMNANRTNAWLNSSQGQQAGWRRVSAAEAQRMANDGHPAIASWTNPTGSHGHIAMVRPGEMGAGGPTIAQAGGTNFNNGSVRRGFGSKTNQVQYFVHD